MNEEFIHFSRDGGFVFLRRASWPLHFLRHLSPSVFILEVCVFGSVLSAMSARFKRDPAHKLGAFCRNAYLATLGFLI